MVQEISQKFCGREFTSEEVRLVQEVVRNCAGLSRTELSHTVSELLEWKRPGGGLKARECMDFLEQLAVHEIIDLPGKKSSGKAKPRKSIAAVQDSRPYSHLCGSVEEFTPLDVELVDNREQRLLFQDLLSRYHYLGYAMPYGARLQYLIHTGRPRREVVACVQFSSPAWRIKARDQWIGWDDGTRSKRLQHVVNNSRLLILARIKNLASMALSRALQHLGVDWLERYGVEPLLVETLVDRQRFHGGCYLASNWKLLGDTSGRGRTDRAHKRHGSEVKKVLVLPLVKNAVTRLSGKGGRP